MKTPNYHVSSLHSEHLDAISKLYLLAFKKDFDMEIFQWKYFNTPSGDAKLIGVYCEQELVGFGTLLPERMSVLGKAETVYKCTDLMVHPSHRKKGLAKLIIDSLMSTITINGQTSTSYTMCSKIATYGFAKNNFVKLSNIYNYFKPVALLKISHLFSPIPKLYSKGIIKKFDLIPDDLSSFSFEVSEDRIEVLKSFDYLKWRINNPKFNYNVICYFENNKVAGYIIVGLGSSNTLNIIDFDVKNKDRKILKSLLKAAEYEAIQNSCRGIVGISKDKGYWTTVLRKHNFLVNRFKKGPLSSLLDFNIFLTKENPNIMKVDNWEINSINYDDV